MVSMVVLLTQARVFLVLNRIKVDYGSMFCQAGSGATLLVDSAEGIDADSYQVPKHLNRTPDDVDLGGSTIVPLHGNFLDLKPPFICDK